MSARHPALTDAALAAVTAVGVLVGTPLTGGHVEVAGAVSLAGALALLVLARRRLPLTVLLLSAATAIALRIPGLTDTGWVWPASVAYVTVAVTDRVGVGRLRRSGLGWAVGIGVTDLIFAANWDGFVDLTRSPVAVGAEALWLALILSAATAYRNGQRWRGELAAGLRRDAHERELQAERRAARERLRIARELHDVVAHTLTVVGVQLRVAAEALDDSPAEARAALDTAQQVRATAVADLRALIGVMRDPAEPGADPVAGREPTVGLDGLGDLLDRVRGTGLDVRLDITGDPSAVPAPVALAAYRIVQESLTNTVRHARAAHAAVRLRCAADEVTVEVTDDGAAAGGAPGGGHGIDGMRERVTALGGTLHAAAADGGGWAVRAAIPVPSWQP